MQKGRRYKLEGSSLIYALTIILLIGTITSSLILLVQYDHSNTRNWISAITVESLSLSGALAGHAQLPMSVDGHEEIADLRSVDQKVLAWKRPWGVFDLVEVHARIGHASHERRALFGPKESSAGVLELTGQSNGLHMCGDARIRGDLLISNTDIRRGYIEGVSFTGDQLIEGKTKEVDPRSMNISDQMYGRCMQLCGLLGLSQEQYSTVNDFVPDSIRVFEPVQVINITGLNVLDDGEWRQCYLRSSDPIRIGPNCSFSDVIIQAPYIELMQGARGSAQLFASEGIYLAKGASLSYPSALVLLPSDSSDAQIEIDEQAEVQGLVMALGKSSARTGTRLSVNAGALVDGCVFIRGGLQNRGTIRGSAIAQELTLRTASSSYRGYLLDGVFEGSKYDFAMGLGMDKANTTYTLINKDWR